MIDRVGLFVHLTAPPPVIRQRLLARKVEKNERRTYRRNEYGAQIRTSGD
ncbi:hypothetical protein [Streptomyces benahoarensis]|nr:hypothetical protein [Streptomyces benahoarensis]